MTTSYGQFCPVAKAMEVLDERWTLLIIRELLMGSTHFNEIRRGVPRMSPALLSKRLRTLERSGLAQREVHGRTTRYTLTPSGDELRPIVEALSLWGLRWIGDLGEEDLDPHLLFWDMSRSLPVHRWPRSRTVVAFELVDLPARMSRWWLVVDGEDVDVCDVDPGHPVALTVRGPLTGLTRIWRGELRWESAIASRDVVLLGPPDLCRELPAWIGDSAFAQLARVAASAAAGREVGPVEKGRAS